MKVALRIKELRLEKGFTQKKLAEMVGCSQPMIVIWEKEEWTIVKMTTKIMV
mgnify:CR=1 FL=1